MIRTKISAWWAALTGVVTFIAGTVVTPLINELHHGEELNERERAFVMDIVKLEIEHPERAVATAQMSTLVTRQYIRNAKFADAFSNMLAAQAIEMAGAGPAVAGTDGGVPPVEAGGGAAPAVGAAATLNQVQTADSLATAASAASASGAITPQAVQPLLHASTDRIFLQIAEAGQRPAARDLRGQLAAALGGGAAVHGVELVESFSGPTQLRYFYPGDQAEANRIASMLRTAYPSLVCQRVGGYEASASVKPRLFEVWLGRGDSPKGAVTGAPVQALCR